MGKLLWEYKISSKAQEALKNNKNVVLVGSPHTSFVDGVHVFLMFSVMRFFKKSINQVLKNKKVGIAMKSEAFPKIIRGILEKVFIAVDRKNPKGFSKTLVKKSSELSDFVIGYAPEGTRKKVRSWKSGFLREAEKRQSPIILGILDYKKKIVELLEVIEIDEFLTDGEIDENKMPQVADKIRDIYKDVVPKNEGGFNPNFKIKLKGKEY